MIDNRDSIAQPLRPLHVVRREDDRFSIRLELGDEIPHLPSRLWIETGRGLVEKKQLRIPNEGAGDGQTLFLPARQSPHP